MYKIFIISYLLLVHLTSIIPLKVKERYGGSPKDCNCIIHFIEASPGSSFDAILHLFYKEIIGYHGAKYESQNLGCKKLFFSCTEKIDPLTPAGYPINGSYTDILGYIQRNVSTRNIAL